MPPIPRTSLVLGLVLAGLLGPGCGGAGGSGGAGDSGSGDAAPAPLPDGLDGFDTYLVERIRAAHAAVEAAPRDPALWMGLGMTYEANALQWLAVECYGRAIELEESARAWSRLAQAEEGQGRLVEARDAMRRAVELDPAYAPSHWRLGNFLFDLGEFDEAKRAFEAARDADPDHLGGATGVARVLLQEARPEDAIVVLEAVLETHPDDATTRRILRTAYIQAGRPASEARASWRRVTSLGKDPWHREFKEFREKPLMERALAALQDGDSAGAVEMLEGFARETDDLNVLSYLAWAHYLNGSRADAMEAIDAALAEDPNNTSVLRVQARIHEADGETDRSLDVLDRILALDGNDLEALEKRGRIQMTSARFEDAAATFERFLQVDRRSPEIWILLGTAQLRLERFGDAAETFREAIGAKARGKEAHVGLARAYAAQGEWSAAVEAMQDIDKLTDDEEAMLRSFRARAAATGGGE